MNNYQNQTPPTVLRNHHQHHHQQHHNNPHFSSSSTSTTVQPHHFTTPAIPHLQPVPLSAPPQPLISNSLAIRQEIQRFESVHPSIYAIYDLIDLLPITDAQIAQQIRDHVVCIEVSHTKRIKKLEYVIYDAKTSPENELDGYGQNTPKLRRSFERALFNERAKPNELEFNNV
ncbi:uncharacterized protein LOC142224586 [Haematobia irritans]|uniref:uncharacterized protein LOC142224586 n=1 Tax=Haematobia irritans TaxID=7368 RepID=UPI003F506EB2